MIPKQGHQKFMTVVICSTTGLRVTIAVAEKYIGLTGISCPRRRRNLSVSLSAIIQHEGTRATHQNNTVSSHKQHVHLPFGYLRVCWCRGSHDDCKMNHPHSQYSVPQVRYLVARQS